ncbi:DNA internalization-related competence protein ComEC/Rec2 [Aquibacillus albus]|uniref:Competence protein ComEC n=1 Tax=Aquibacillus albus TaxID=1168171 RepID=A0ABS2MUM7_9BACI|nr:DNA internalization-related competence protein ComEC/Rec2 [Aquibacillus albus]MBM7569602.1 competence protein ComEC [Aquibacillus albus]
MKGRWHLYAMAAVAAILSASINSIIIFLFVLWVLWLYKKSRLNFIQLVIIKVMFISYYFLFHSNLFPFVASVSDEEELIMGQITSEVLKLESRIEFVMENNANEKFFITFFYNQNSPIADTEMLKTGAICVLNGQIKLPSTSRNPGEFDYRKYLEHKDIRYQITLNHLKDVRCVGDSLSNIIYDWRKALLESTKSSISNDTVPWLHGLVLGKDDELNDETIAMYQRWNLSHLLAISGLHVSLFAGVVYLLLVKGCFVTKEKAQGILIGVLLFYPLLSGGAPSVWRASVMTVFGLLLIRMRLSLTITDIISIVFLIFTMIHPTIIYHIGFQFSFLVTFAIILSKPILLSHSHKIVQLFKLSFISLFAILPLQVYYFYAFNPLSILMNIIFVPYYTLFVIPLMFIMLPLSIVLPWIIPPIDYLFSFIHQLSTLLLHKVDAYLYYPWVIGVIPLYIFVPYYVLLCLFFANLVKSKYKAAFLSGLMITLTLVMISLKPYFSSTGTVTMLDVGQGDSMVIELPYRKGIVIIDAAGTITSDFTTSSDKLYQQIIKPFLYSKGIVSIDKVILSHEDLDHAGSIQFIVEDFHIDEVVVSEQFIISDSMQKQFTQKNLDISRVSAGDIIDVNNHFFYVLSPLTGTNAHSSNENSLTLFSEIGGLKWLFTGDIDDGIEEEIIQSYPNLKIDVLKIAHHGSATSTSEPWLQQIEPRIALLSVGENNRYGHPSEKVIKNLEDYNVKLFRTDFQGAIQYIFSNNNGTFQTHLP